MFILLIFIRESRVVKEGERRREEKEERERKKTTFVYTVFVLFQQGSEMAFHLCH